MRIRCAAAALGAILLVNPGLMADDVQRDEHRPDYRLMMQRNMLLPGSAQKMLGNDDEAVLYYLSLPLMVEKLPLLVDQWNLTLRSPCAWDF